MKPLPDIYREAVKFDAESDVRSALVDKFNCIFEEDNSLDAFSVAMEEAARTEAHRRQPIDEALAECLKALEFYADKTNWERIEGHTKWASNLTAQDCAMLNCGGGRARLAIEKLRAILDKGGGG